MKTFDLLLFASALGLSTGSISAAPVPDFYQWLETEPGRSASLAQLQQQCDRERDAVKNLSCSVTVLARMFEAKAANQLPALYRAIKSRHGRAIEADPELKQLFAMFGSRSLAMLAATPDFSVRADRRHEVLRIYPYANDFYVAEAMLPFIEVGAANGASARFVLDTGAPQTRINIDTARQMGIRLLPDASYRYRTFYGEGELSARLGIIDSLIIGSSEFRHVLVFVSDRENLLGLDLISKLGHLRISRRTLELKPAPDPRCDTPVAYTRQDLNQRLLAGARLDRRATMAIIDTGNVDYLTAALPGDPVNILQSLTPGNSPASTAGKQRYQSFKGVLSTQRASVPVTYKYYPGFTIPPSLVAGHYVPSLLLGWQAFTEFELDLNIDAGRSCLNKA